MNKKVKICTLVLGALISYSSFAKYEVVKAVENNNTKINYLQDSDFENVSNKWIYNKGKIIKGIGNDGGSHIGSISSGINSGFIGQNVKVKKNTKYILSAYIKSNHKNSYAFLSARKSGNGSGKLIKDIKVTPSNEKWSKVELAFNSGENDNVLVQYVKWISSNDKNYNDVVDSTLYIDNMQLVEKDSEADQYIEVWKDDFNGDVLNLNNWGYELGHIRGTEEQEYVSSEKNVFVKDGKLYLRATKKDIPKTIKKGNNVSRVLKYDSGSIETFGKKDVLYGRIEMRAKLPSGAGAFPAFWTLGSDFKHDGLLNEGTNWPNCGEIDIMELIGKNPNKSGTSDNIVYGTLHYGTDYNSGYRHQGGSFNLRKSFSDNYHTFGINWTKDFIEWDVDGYVYNRINIKDNEYFNKPHYIKLNLAVGGGWPGYANENTKFPMDYVIDYVKYSQTEKQMNDEKEYRKNLPEISLAENTYTIKCGENIPDLLSGVKAKDSQGNDLKVNYSIEDGKRNIKEIDINKPGEYSVVYTTIDRNNRYARAFAKLIINK